MGGKGREWGEWRKGRKGEGKVRERKGGGRLRHGFLGMDAPGP